MNNEIELSSPVLAVPTISPIETITVSERVYQWVKDAIINGDFKPGERIVQETLTQHLGVSRTPVRDALQRLSTEGLVVNTPFYGAEVFALSRTSLEEIYEIRILLETFAAEKACDTISEDELNMLDELNREIALHHTDANACMRYDREFHRIICCAAQSTYMMDILNAAWDKSDPYKSIYYTLDDNIDRTVAEHSHMIQSFRNHDHEALKHAIAEHLHDVVEMVSRRSKAFGMKE